MKLIDIFVKNSFLIAMINITIPLVLWDVGKLVHKKNVKLINNVMLILFSIYLIL